MHRNNGMIVLNALLAGRKVKIGDETWCMSEDYEVCMPGKRYKAGDEENYEEVAVRVDMTVGTFFKMCEKLTENELFVIGANTVLTEISNSGGLSKWSAEQERNKHG